MAEKFQQIDKKTYLPVFNRWPITLAKGKGASVWDTENKKYIDALAGIAVNSVGHCHPNVVKAIRKQSKKLIHISNFYASKPQAKLSKELTKLSGLSRAFFSNSGAEANEAAIKIARKYANSKGKGGTVLSFEGCFHGRTLATIATGKKKYQEGFEPIPKGFVQLPFNNIEALKKVISPDIAAIIIELVQGEGGINIADFEFIQDIKAICEKEDIVLIFDEIQTGMGRTGELFAFEHYQVNPDIITLAKALGGGFPIGATLFNEKIAQSVSFGDHGTTFGGNPLACAAALASVKTIKKEKLAERSQKLGEKIKAYITDLAIGEETVKEVRGMGLMIGVELTYPGRPVVEDLLKKGILGNVTADNVIRLVPPLVIKEKDLFYVVDEVFKSIKKEGSSIGSKQVK